LAAPALDERDAGAQLPGDHGDDLGEPAREVVLDACRSKQRRDGLGVVGGAYAVTARTSSIMPARLQLGQAQQVGRPQAVRGKHLGVEAEQEQFGLVEAQRGRAAQRRQWRLSR
jgi:hypothetical protein